MSDAAVSQEAHRIDNWLLAILRFAITHQEIDRAVILTMAEKMDRCGARSAPSGFAFFARTGDAICELIVGNDSPRKTAALRRYLSEVDNSRLRRALEAALDVEPPATKIRKLRGRHREDLWRDLAMRL